MTPEAIDLRPARGMSDTGADNRRILVVDDQEPVRRSLTKFLEGQRYVVSVAASAEEALAATRKHRFACVLLDVNLPGGPSGADVVPHLLEAEPDLAVVMLSGLNDAMTAALCMQRGAADYLTKPIELTELGAAIGRSLKRRQLAIEERERHQLLRGEMARRTGELERDRDRLEQLSVATLELLVYALESRNDFLSGHSRRVADFAASVAAAMGRTEDEVEVVRLAGRLHDIGLIRTREELLTRAGPLTSDELDHVRQHVVLGWQLLTPLSRLGPVAEFVRGHHERWDGTGYPDGLEAQAIPWGAQVLAAAEVYDALTTARPYREKLSLEAAVECMRSDSGKSLSPEVFTALAGVVSCHRALVFVDERVETA